MSILNSCHFATALLVFIAVAQSPTWVAGDGFFSQTNQNPLNVGNGINPNEFSSSPPPFGNSAFAPPDGPTFSNGPAITTGPAFSSSSSASASANGFSSSPPPFVGGHNNYDISDAIAENVLQFGHNIGQKLNEFDPHASRSEIFSPLSVMSALSLLALGAKGRSYQELSHLLGLDSSTELASKYHEEFGSMLDDLQHFDVNNAKVSSSSSTRKQPNWRYTNPKMAAQRPFNPLEVQHTINVANGLFVQKGYSLNPDYSQVVRSVYDSELTQLDYQRKSREALEYINNWVNNSTKGKIPQIITDEISRSTNVILASVLYFRGFWETSFFPRSTNEDNFYQDGLNSPPIRVQMMATGGLFPFYDAKDYDCRIIGLPYRGNETTMYVIQPNNSTRQKLRDLMNILNARIINDMIDNMSLKTTVMVFPKMHFTRTLTLKNMLQSMGVGDIFSAASSDLSLIGAGGRRAAASAGAAASSGASASANAPRLPTIHVSVERTRLSVARPLYYDRFNESALIFASRFSEIATMGPALPSSSNSADTDDSQHTISKRQVPISYPSGNAQALANLEEDRSKFGSYSSDLYVDEIVHKVDFAVDEQGTEAAAATVTYLHRSGTDVIFRGDAPFLILIRHDPTKLPLFYGIINRPEL